MTLKQLLMTVKGYKSIGLYNAEDEKPIDTEASISSLYIYEDQEVNRADISLFDEPGEKNLKNARICIYLNINITEAA